MPAKKAPTHQPLLQSNPQALATVPAPSTEQDASGLEISPESLGQIVGRIQMNMANESFNKVIRLQHLQYIKDHKLYRNSTLKNVNDRFGRPIENVRTWDGFCRSIGTSADTLDEQLLNLEAFGEEALGHLAAVGAGVRDLRKLRKLPEDSRVALIEAAKAGDKEGFLDLAEEIISRNSKRLEEKDRVIEDLKGDLAATQARLSIVGKVREREEQAAADRLAQEQKNLVLTLQNDILREVSCFEVVCLKFGSMFRKLKEADENCDAFIAGAFKNMTGSLKALEDEHEIKMVSDFSRSQVEWMDVPKEQVWDRP